MTVFCFVLFYFFNFGKVNQLLLTDMALLPLSAIWEPNRISLVHCMLCQVFWPGQEYEESIRLLYFNTFFLRVWIHIHLFFKPTNESTHSVNRGVRCEMYYISSGDVIGLQNLKLQLSFYFVFCNVVLLVSHFKLTILWETVIFTLWLPLFNLNWIHSFVIPTFLCYILLCTSSAIMSHY